MRKVLAEIHSVIDELEKEGLQKEAQEMNEVFLKVSQFQEPYKPITMDYLVKPGDGLISIAKKFNTTQEQLYKLNPGLSASLQIGSPIKVPKPGGLDKMFEKIGPYLGEKNWQNNKKKLAK